MEDQQIIQMYENREEEAIVQSSNKYGHMLSKIAYNILLNLEDSEECVNDTYEKAWSTIPPVKPNCLLAYLGRITRNLSINLWHSNHAKKRDTGASILLSELEDCIPSGHDVEAEVELTALTGVITDWLYSLEKEERILFMKRYWYGESVNMLAKEVHTTPNKLAGRIFRLRLKLKTVLEKEGYLYER